MKRKYVKKALASALAAALLAGGINGTCVRAENMEPAQEEVISETGAVPEELGQTVEEVTEETEQTVEEVTEETKQNAEEVAEETKQDAEEITEETKQDAETAVPEMEVSNEAEGISDVSAAASGTCGVSATWTYQDGVLTISGTGEVGWDDSMGYFWAPWYAYKEEITEVVVADGIKNFSTRAAYNTFTSKIETVKLPETLEELPSFSHCSKLKEIVIPSKITEIPSDAFLECTSLTKVTAPSVTKLGLCAFQDCSNLKEVTLGDNFEADVYAFRGCNALADENGMIIIGNKLCWVVPEASLELEIPEGVTNIAHYAFPECKIVSIKIPSTLQCDYKVLSSELCTIDTLEKIEVAEGNSQFTSLDGCLLNKDKTILVACPNAKKGSYTIPKGVETIGYVALSRCAYLTEVFVPETVKAVENSGLFTENFAPIYFEGNAVTGVPDDGQDLFYNKDWDNAYLTLDTLWASQMRARISEMKIYCKEGTTGWDRLKAEYPRVQWLTWNGTGHQDNENSGGNSNNVPEISVTGQTTTEALTTALISAITASEPRAKITVEVQEGCTLTKDVMQLLKDKGDMLVVNSNTAGGKVTWTFNKIENVIDFNPAATVGAQIADIANKLKGTSLSYVQVSFAHEGILPGTAEIYLDLSAYKDTFAEGTTLYLHYYNPSTGGFEKVSAGSFDGTGITFTMEHCSDYVVTNADKVSAVNTASKNTTAPKTGDDSGSEIMYWLMLMSGALLLLAIYVGIFKKKEIRKGR